ncbi:hypothetical protein [Sandaracinus amylolyticus]|uniref:MotA/TolQ/ExbB proton channel domain-containing protein n=1 Tax=Sandaracinus amylolyticus TaxID=927083 RepID=A0A0F6SF73_9BACT|nr:hypothetical protein [Sandaracinus amylolyticus]AKF06444.1 hypothetical protein DB32_003593 [Sandaracinus amylolyticus]
MGLVALVVERLRALCVSGPVDVDPLVKALRSAPEETRPAIVDAIAGTFVGRALAPLWRADARSIDVELEESLADARAAITSRLQAIRIGATLSTFLGFVGAAIALSWVHSGDHGLLALDPRRVSAIGLSHAALSIALGVGGSSFALGSWMTLRAHARRLIDECDRAVDRARAVRGS